MNSPQPITEAQFFEAVDRFIGAANELARKYPVQGINAAIMYAAARYNAFNWISRDQMLDHTVDQAAVLFRAEYENMFRENVSNLNAERARS
jgi:hypothetical protein